MNKKPVRLKFALFRAFVLVAFLPPVLLLAANDFVVQPRLERDFAARAASLARGAANTAEYALTLARSSLEELAFLVEAGTDRKSLSRAIDAKVSAFPSFEAILILDPTGRVDLTGTAGSEYVGLDLSDLPLFLAPDATTRVFYGNAFVSPFSGKSSAFIAVKSASGFRIAGAFRLSGLSAAVVPADPASRVRLLDGLGTVIASDDPREVAMQLNLRPLALAAPDPAQANEGYVYGFGADALRCFLSEVPCTPWKVIASYPEASIAATLNFERLALALASLLGLVASLALARTLSERVTRPVAALLAATRSLEAPRIPRNKPAALELIELAENFSHMRARVTEHEAALEAALAQREVLLRELHHRVKNNLQIVASLLSLQRGRDLSPEAEAALSESSERVRTLALVHEKLYRSSDFATVDLGEYLGDIYANVLGAACPAGWTAGEAAGLRVDIEGAIPVGLIVNEILSNALKYAGRGGRPPKVELILEPLEGGYRLSITDDGPGFDLAAARASGRLGLVLIESLAHQLGATLNIDASGPTRYELIVPAKRRKAANDQG